MEVTSLERVILASEPAEMGVGMYRRILIVEDEALLRRTIARNLTRRGHVVREAETAAEAVSASLEDRPDLMLLDINLPDRTGWDVLRELRQHEIEIPTIIVSAVRVGPERIDEFRPLAYLPKPFPLEALLRLVQGKSSPEASDNALPRINGESPAKG